MQISHCVTKSKAAFLMSADRMFEIFPKVYFWTFTWPTPMPDWRYGQSWNSFVKKMQWFFGNTVAGLRVWEIHPAFYSHGLHCHALINRRLNIHLVRRLAKRAGMGHCWVVRANPDTKFYLAKYMTKENGLTEGMRQWGTIGGFKQVKKNSIVVESDLTHNIQFCQNEVKMAKMSYAFFLWLGNQTLRHGRVEDWPIERVGYVTQRNFTAQKVKHIKLDEPDDDGINEQISPVRDGLSKLHVLNVNGQYGRTQVFYRMKKWEQEQPF